MARRVVITGIGMVSPLGLGARENWEALVRGTPGVGPITGRFIERASQKLPRFETDSSPSAIWSSSCLGGTRVAVPARTA